jgi:hypothetical protein
VLASSSLHARSSARHFQPGKPVTEAFEPLKGKDNDTFPNPVCGPGALWYLVRSQLKIGIKFIRDASSYDIVVWNRSIDSVVLVAKYHDAVNDVVQSEVLTSTRLVKDHGDVVMFFADGESLCKVKRA